MSDAAPAVERWLAWRYLATRQREGFVSFIAIFSLIGVALGVATLIVVLSVMGGFRQQLLGRIIGMNGHIVITANGGGMVQATFGLDHVAGSEAVLAACVLAEFDQIGRAAHRAHNRVELLGSVAVTMREDSHVAAREGRLLMRDGV